MNWYKFHIGDYITHTLHLSDAEDLAYRRLMDIYYMSEKPIPLEVEHVARKIRLDIDITEAVLAEFFVKTEEGYRNARCDEEIGRYRHQVETNRELGKRGGRPKKTDSGTEPEPEGNPNQKKNQKKKTLSSARFDEFWATWPASKRKMAKAACQEKWARMGLDEKADEVIRAVETLKVSEQWLSGFEPAPMTFLNQRRWEDVISVVPERRAV